MGLGDLHRAIVAGRNHADRHVLHARQESNGRGAVGAELGDGPEEPPDDRGEGVRRVRALVGRREHHDPAHARRRGVAREDVANDDVAQAVPDEMDAGVLGPNGGRELVPQVLADLRDRAAVAGVAETHHLIAFGLERTAERRHGDRCASHAMHEYDEFVGCDARGRTTRGARRVRRRLREQCWGREGEEQGRAADCRAYHAHVAGRLGQCGHASNSLQTSRPSSTPSGKWAMKSARNRAACVARYRSSAGRSTRS